MSNPLYNSLMGTNKFSQMANEFKQFKNQMQGINPKDEVMKALQSGRINQQQLNQFQAMANQLQNFLK